MCVYLSACIPLSELDAFSMSLDHLMDKVSDSQLPRGVASVKLVPMLFLVIASEVQLHLILQEGTTHCLT